MQDEIRKQKALEILSRLNIQCPHYLGQGCEGVVFHDDSFVYKIHLDCPNKLEIKRRLSYFTDLTNCKTLYRIEECIEVGDSLVAKYKYEPSIPCHNYSENEAIEFLTECYQHRIAIRDCKPRNFIFVSDFIKLVDMEACSYTDNLFLNMCVRMYVYIHFFDTMSTADFQKLKRSVINNFDLPELESAREFVNKVFANIIYRESQSVTKKFKIIEDDNQELYSIGNLPNLEQLFYHELRSNRYLSDIQISDIRLNESLYFEPEKIALHFDALKPLQEKVTLLIKTCPQDEPTIETNIKHIVRQLSAPNPFSEIVVSIDTKRNDFLREYNSKGNIENLIAIVQRLKDDRIIDRFVIFDESKTEELNRRWFDVPSKYSHTTGKIPVTPQLYAFENCKGDYILQADSDVIIGRRDLRHSFLTDLIDQLKRNEKVISVGFNIYNRTSKDYFGFEDGGFVPEVRLGLIDKNRLFSLRPFPNEMDKQGKLTLSWHRSVEKFQKQSGYCSIRGGDNRTFYIHPQNYRKKQPYAWLTILDRVEQMHLPDMQYGCWDCEGSLYDWCIPKRNEEMIIVSCFRNVSIPRFLRFWCSLMSQSNQQFGLILYDDCSDNGLPLFIRRLIQPYKERITFISSKCRDARMANVYRSIHYYCNNPESIIVMVDADDALIGKDVLQDVLEKYVVWEKDVVLGRVYQTYRLQPHYRYPANFVQPRKTSGGNVYQHLKTFKKYLFDSIPLTYFKYNHIDKVRLNNNLWLESCDDYAMMIPIVEMSANPLQMDDINYFYERDYKNRNAERDLKEKCIAEIINKPSLSSEQVRKGRQTFRPDFERIEIDITYECNLKCIGCNRSCGQVPSTEKLGIQDIEKFIGESVHYKKKWQIINILGGEPTLHPDFLKILSLLQQYAESFSPETIIKVVSNGITERSRLLCEEARNKYKNVIIDYSSYKTTNNVDYFTPFNDAPVDDVNFKEADFTKACWVTDYCGIGLTPRGYFACAVCGGIDRVQNGNRGVGSFTELTEEKLKEHYSTFCPLCGNFMYYEQNAGNFIPRCEKEPFKNIVSPAWKKLYTLNYSKMEKV